MGLTGAVLSLRIFVHSRNWTIFAIPHLSCKLIAIKMRENFHYFIFALDIIDSSMNVNMINI